VNRAVEFAIGEGLVDLDNAGKAILTAKGNLFLKNLLDDEELFTAIKRDLMEIGKAVTETKVADILRM
jgi:hypothetical protein